MYTIEDLKKCIVGDVNESFKNALLNERNDGLSVAEIVGGYIDIPTKSDDEWLDYAERYEGIASYAREQICGFRGHDVIDTYFQLYGVPEDILENKVELAKVVFYLEEVEDIRWVFKTTMLAAVIDVLERFGETTFDEERAAKVFNEIPRLNIEMAKTPKEYAGMIIGSEGR